MGLSTLLILSSVTESFVLSVLQAHVKLWDGAIINNNRMQARVLVVDDEIFDGSIRPVSVTAAIYMVVSITDARRLPLRAKLLGQMF